MYMCGVTLHIYFYLEYGYYYNNLFRKFSSVKSFFKKIYQHSLTC